MTDIIAENSTISEVWHFAAALLIRHGFASAKLDARLLVGCACDLPLAAMVSDPDYRLSRRETTIINDLLKRRLDHEPVSRIVGHCGFYDYDFTILPGVFIPRPETELIVDAALQIISDRRLRIKTIADIGCGSGALTISLLKKLPTATATAIDISKRALDNTLLNAKQQQVEERLTIIKGDATTYLSDLGVKFDLVVTNPPYIPTADLPFLQPDVIKHDPVLALDGGVSGLDFYNLWTGMIVNRLNRNGVVVVENGINQSKNVISIMTSCKLRDIRIWKDLAGIERVVSGINY